MRTRVALHGSAKILEMCLDAFSQSVSPGGGVRTEPCNVPIARSANRDVLARGGGHREQQK
jgi:hypothetical protein